ncbi:GL24884 [Drosophila persimilis]|uniref:GL24884 n=1 Tax=Drosophila persimilis TaxID=7234 RepID=B4GRR7_DROPE|nr:GL24884 [Drosophila persimilis]
MGDGDDLTSQAIAELIREIEGGDARSCSGVQERKVNPLGKPNKRFLGRTINTALRHNQREKIQADQTTSNKLALEEVVLEANEVETKDALEQFLNG